MSLCNIDGDASVGVEGVPTLQQLFLIWKSPNRRYHKVGVFEERLGGGYRFSYVDTVRDIPDFRPLVQFPDFDETYESDVLPAFFSNRMMNMQRVGYDRYLSWLGFEDDAAPLEVMARTGGGRATDTFHLVDTFKHGETPCSGMFFVSGIRHCGGDEVVTELKVGAPLSVEPDPYNPINPHALFITVEGTRLGWIPDWLVETFHDAQERADVALSVAQINVDAPPHLRVMCQLVITPRL